MRQECLPQKMWFSTEACLLILRLSLKSRCQNKSIGGLEFWFWVPISPARKTMQTLTLVFHNLSRKMRIFLQRTSNIGKLNTVLKFLEKWVISYHFQVWVTLKEREMTSFSRKPHIHWSPTINLVNNLSPSIGSDFLSPRKMIHGTYAPAEGCRWTNQWQWVTQGPAANAQPLPSTMLSGAPPP